MCVRVSIQTLQAPLSYRLVRYCHVCLLWSFWNMWGEGFSVCVASLLRRLIVGKAVS